MKATELRIGDYFEWFASEVVRITFIAESYVNAEDDRGVEQIQVRLTDLRPIQLTEEILKKNGWKENDEIWTTPYPFGQIAVEFFKWGTEKVAMVSVVSGSMSSDTNTLRQIRYVHELQHLLWALGIEKEVEV